MSVLVQFSYLNKDDEYWKESLLKWHHMLLSVSHQLQVIVHIEVSIKNVLKMIRSRIKASKTMETFSDLPKRPPRNLV